MYLVYFTEYDRDDFDWTLVGTTTFTKETTVAAEAEIVLNHILNGDQDKERVKYAIAYLVLKANS